jgi:hypothetical protein
MSSLAPRFSIGYVARSFASNPAASRALLERVFDPKRLDKYAHIEVPALAQQIANIAPYDATFAVSIYGHVFGYHVGSQRETRITDSHILPMTSNASQDYDLARYSLAQHFSTFLKENPVAATEAIIAALEGDVVVRRHISEQATDIVLNVDGKQLALREDGSAIWAWDRNSTHPESMDIIVQQFVGYLRNAGPAEIDPVLNKLFEKNRLGLLWARLLMVGAERPEVFANRLWGLATNEQVLLSASVSHDAIAAVVAFYSSRSMEARRAFELAAFGYGADDQVHQSVRQHWLAILFQAIGADQLVTEQARSFLATEEGSKPSPNTRFEIFGGATDLTQRQILMDAGVDVDEPTNDQLLSMAEDVKVKAGLVHGGNSSIENIPEALEQLKLLYTAIESAGANEANNDVLCTAEETAGDLCTAIFGTAAQTKVELSAADLAALELIAVGLSSSKREHYGRAPRAGVVPALFSLCQHPAVMTEPLRRLQTMARDPNLAVRHAVVRTLVTLRQVAPTEMWEMADVFISAEKDAGVMQGFAAALLGRTRFFDAPRTEAMLLAIQSRFPFSVPRNNGGRRNPLDETMAHLFALLYVWHDLESSKQEVFRWAADPLRYEEQIRSGLWMVREAASAGYDADSPEARQPRERVQALITAVVDQTAGVLEAHFRLESAAQKAHHQEALTYAKCLGYACSSCYFGSGAFPERNGNHIAPIQSNAGKERFIADMGTTLQRIGDIAVPHTMYELVQLFDFLLPGNPEACFDLFAHALTTSGRMQGFQLESLGVDVLVRVVSRCLADYEYIFRDEGRRKRLIECLDVFVDAGWPAALRLLYGLPDALR